MVDLDLVYNISLHKLHSFQTTRGESDGLRKLVLLNNFVLKKFVLPEQQEPLEWSEEDIKKDEESWLDSCLDSLDEEEEEGYIYVNKPPECRQPSPPTTPPFPINHYDNPQHYEDRYDYMECDEPSPNEKLSKTDNVVDDVIIPHDLLHLPFFDPGGEEDSSSHMAIDEEQSPMEINNLENTSINPSENLTCEKGFHPYWKDNSIIDHSTKSPPFRSYFDLDTCSFGIPKIFHKYLVGNVSSPRCIVPSSAFREFLQPDYPYQPLEFYDASLKRSKDDLDILYSLNPRDLDQGILMDMIGMLEYYGGKKSGKKSNSSENNDIWFVDNDDHMLS